MEFYYPERESKLQKSIRIWGVKTGEYNARLEAQLRQPIPERGQGYTRVYDAADELVEPNLLMWETGRQMGYPIAYQRYVPEHDLEIWTSTPTSIWVYEAGEQKFLEVRQRIMDLMLTDMDPQMMLMAFALTSDAEPNLSQNQELADSLNRSEVQNIPMDTPDAIPRAYVTGLMRRSITEELAPEDCQQLTKLVNTGITPYTVSEVQAMMGKRIRAIVEADPTLHP